MSKNYLLHHTIVEPFDKDLYLFVGEFEKYNEWLKRKFNEHCKQIGDTQTSWGENGRHITVWLSPAKNWGTVVAALLAHEAVHVTWQLYRSVGPIFDANTDETQSYLVQRITHDWYQFLDKNTTMKGRYKLD